MAILCCKIYNSGISAVASINIQQQAADLCWYQRGSWSWSWSWRSSSSSYILISFVEVATVWPQYGPGLGHICWEFPQRRPIARISWFQLHILKYYHCHLLQNHKKVNMHKRNSLIQKNHFSTFYHQSSS